MAFRGLFSDALGITYSLVFLARSNVIGVKDKEIVILPHKNYNFYRTAIILNKLVLLVVQPEKRCTTDCDSCTKTVPQPRKMGRNRGFFSPFLPILWYTFRFRVPKLGILF